MDNRLDELEYIPHQENNGKVLKKKNKPLDKQCPK